MEIKDLSSAPATGAEIDHRASAAYNAVTLASSMVSMPANTATEFKVKDSTPFGDDEDDAAAFFLSAEDDYEVENFSKPYLGSTATLHGSQSKPLLGEEKQTWRDDSSIYPVKVSPVKPITSFSVKSWTDQSPSLSTTYESKTDFGSLSAFMGDMGTGAADLDEFDDFLGTTDTQERYQKTGAVSSWKEQTVETSKIHSGMQPMPQNGFSSDLTVSSSASYTSATVPDSQVSELPYINVQEPSAEGFELVDQNHQEVRADQEDQQDWGQQYPGWVWDYDVGEWKFDQSVYDASLGAITEEGYITGEQSTKINYDTTDYSSGGQETNGTLVVGYCGQGDTVSNLEHQPRGGNMPPATSESTAPMSPNGALGAVNSSHTYEDELPSAIEVTDSKAEEAKENNLPSWAVLESQQQTWDDDFQQKELEAESDPKVFFDGLGEDSASAGALGLGGNLEETANALAQFAAISKNNSADELSPNQGLCFPTVDFSTPKEAEENNEGFQGSSLATSERVQGEASVQQEEILEAVSVASPTENVALARDIQQSVGHEPCALGDVLGNGTMDSLLVAGGSHVNKVGVPASAKPITATIFKPMSLQERSGDGQEWFDSIQDSPTEGLGLNSASELTVASIPFNTPAEPLHSEAVTNWVKPASSVTSDAVPYLLDSSASCGTINMEAEGLEGQESTVGESSMPSIDVGALDGPTPSNDDLPGDEFSAQGESQFAVVQKQAPDVATVLTHTESTFAADLAKVAPSYPEAEHGDQNIAQGHEEYIHNQSVSARLLDFVEEQGDSRHSGNTNVYPREMDQSQEQQRQEAWQGEQPDQNLWAQADVSGYVEGQQLQEQQTAFEEYPGWVWDYSVGEWRQVEVEGAAEGPTIAVDELQGLGEGGQNPQDESLHSYNVASGEDVQKPGIEGVEQDTGSTGYIPVAMQEFGNGTSWNQGQVYLDDYQIQNANQVAEQNYNHALNLQNDASLAQPLEGHVQAPYPAGVAPMTMPSQGYAQQQPEAFAWSQAAPYSGQQSYYGQQQLQVPHQHPQFLQPQDPSYDVYQPQQQISNGFGGEPLNVDMTGNLLWGAHPDSSLVNSHEGSLGYMVQQQQQQQQLHLMDIAPRTKREALRSPAGRPPCSVAAFGFGGRLVVVKLKNPQKMGSTNSLTGSSSSRSSLDGLGSDEHASVPLQIHSLRQVVVGSGLDLAGGTSQGAGASYFASLSKHAYSGPLADGKVSTKELLKWLDERAAKCQEEEAERAPQESLRLLWGLLKVACHNYGKLRGAGGTGASMAAASDGPEAALANLLTSAAAPGESGWATSRVAANPFLVAPSDQDLQATGREMTSLLVCGKMREALQVARQGQLWGLALILARRLGEKVYLETVFDMAHRQLAPGTPLRTLSLLMAGQPAEIFSGSGAREGAASKPMAATSNPVGFQGALPSGPGSDEGLEAMLNEWQENLAVIAANRMPGDEQVISHLGDCLWHMRGEVAAAHTCYVVADCLPEAFSLTARICLLGADHWKQPRTFATAEAIQRTEVLEHARQMGNPQFVLPPLQPYKVLYATMLVEAGKTQEALRYCAAAQKAVRSAGRNPATEACRLAAAALEDRLKVHLQGASSGGLYGTVKKGFWHAVDGGMRKLIGGAPTPTISPTTSPPPEPAMAPPLPPVPSSGLGAVMDGWGSINGTGQTLRTPSNVPQMPSYPSHGQSGHQPNAPHQAWNYQGAPENLASSHSQQGYGALPPLAPQLPPQLQAVPNRGNVSNWNYNSQRPAAVSSLGMQQYAYTPAAAFGSPVAGSRPSANAGGARMLVTPQTDYGSASYSNEQPQLPLANGLHAEPIGNGSGLDPFSMPVPLPPPSHSTHQQTTTEEKWASAQGTSPSSHVADEAKTPSSVTSPSSAGPLNGRKDEVDSGSIQPNYLSNHDAMGSVPDPRLNSGPPSGTTALPDSDPSHVNPSNSSIAAPGELSAKAASKPSTSASSQPTPVKKSGIGGFLSFGRQKSSSVAPSADFQTPAEVQTTSSAGTLSNSPVLEGATSATMGMTLSASMDPVHNSAQDGRDENVAVPTRSVSEPDFSRQGKSGPSVSGAVTAAAVTAKTNAAAAQDGDKKGVFSVFSRFASFGKKTGQAKLGGANSFYYDEKLKRWVDKDAPILEEEAPLGPPPTSLAYAPSAEMSTAGAAVQPPQELSSGSKDAPQSGPSDALVGRTPPIPPSGGTSVPRSRGRINSRYVDTFNKRGAAAAIATPSIPSFVAPRRSGGAPPASFFVPAPLPSTTTATDGDADQQQDGDSPGQAPPALGASGESLARDNAVVSQGGGSPVVGQPGEDFGRGSARLVQQAHPESKPEAGLPGAAAWSKLNQQQMPPSLHDGNSAKPPGEVLAEPRAPDRGSFAPPLLGMDDHSTFSEGYFAGTSLGRSANTSFSLGPPALLPPQVGTTGGYGSILGGAGASSFNQDLAQALGDGQQDDELQEVEL